ncbi:MAG: transposase [Actinomycetota bacterium]|nr:transposase [Actinomycetota bacterium]
MALLVQVNALRNALRDFYPAAIEAFGADLDSSDALAVLEVAPTPEEGRRLTPARIGRALRAGGRQRYLDRRAGEIRTALQAPQLGAPQVVARAYGEAVRSMVRVIAGLHHETLRLEAELRARFEEHPDAEILRSLPGLGLVLGARVLAEFGDDPTRYRDARARRCYAGSAPVTRASGSRLVVIARVARNRRLADASHPITCSSQLVIKVEPSSHVPSGRPHGFRGVGIRWTTCSRLSPSRGH